MQSQLVSELERLQQLHATGFLSDEELAQAKAKLLGDAPNDAVTVEEADAMLERVDRMERKADSTNAHLALAQLDADWLQEQEGFAHYSKHGNRSLPTEGSALSQAIAFCVPGVISLLMAALVFHIQSSQPFHRESLPLIIFGGVGALLLFVGAPFAYVNASQAEREFAAAQERYHERREALEAKIREAEPRENL